MPGIRLCEAQHRDREKALASAEYGFGGSPVKANESYLFSVWARFAGGAKRHIARRDEMSPTTRLASAH